MRASAFFEIFFRTGKPRWRLRFFEIRGMIDKVRKITLNQTRRNDHVICYIRKDAFGRTEGRLRRRRFQCGEYGNGNGRYRGGRGASGAADAADWICIWQM